MAEWLRRDFAGRDHHARAHARPVPELHGKAHRHADAAMRRRIAWQCAGMQRDPGPGDALHVRHRRTAIEIGAVELVFLNDAEHAHRRRMAAHAGRHRRFREQAVGVVHLHRLVRDRHRNHQRSLRLAGLLVLQLKLAVDGGIGFRAALGRRGRRRFVVIIADVGIRPEQRSECVRRAGGGNQARRSRHHGQRRCPPRC